MPTYWYRCQTCGHEFEEFQKMSDPPLRDCPKCGGIIMRVITGGTGMIFKGSGFYTTDHRKESYKKAESSDKGSSPAPTPSTETKTKPKSE